MVEKERAVWMCGSAMFTIVASRTTMSWHAAMTASATPGRPGRRAAPGIRGASSRVLVTVDPPEVK
ncbi:hypothetical protein Slala05_40790 [Streptomyces lavendulae subsp. lavendulae]|nr:hypothetical protein Slala05_40790 [Streptomyces lavendulae subsp. lavendulae]